MIPAGVRIFAATAPVDMRRGFVGLAEAARDGLGHDPGGDALLVFLWHDRTGWCLLYKALDGGISLSHLRYWTYRLPRNRVRRHGGGEVV